MENIDDQKLSYYKFITIIGLILFVSFSFFYYSPISELEQQVIALNMQIDPHVDGLGGRHRDVVDAGRGDEPG